MKHLFTTTVLLLAGLCRGQEYTSSCPDEWVKWKNYCYLFANTLKVTWDTARTECSVRHAHLLRIDSVDEFIFVRQQFEQHASDGYWTSLNDLPLNEPLNTTKGTHVWLWGHNGYPLKEIVAQNWDKEPDNTEREDCVTVSSQAALAVGNCASRHGYMCQIAAAAQDGACPDGNWYSGPPDDTMCYYVSDVTVWSEVISWKQARQKCESMAPFPNEPTRKAKMLTIPTLDMTNYLAANMPYYARAKPNQVYWTALNDIQNEGTFVWAGNENVPFDEKAIHWRQEPNNLGGHENCGTLLAGGFWSDRNCEAKVNYICRMALPGSPQEWNMGCGQWSRAGRKCVSIYNTPMLAWQDARAFCRSEGGDLLKFENEDDKMWLKMQAFNVFQKPYYWIGLNDIQEENTFRWADGSWAEGYLLDWDSEPNNFDRITGSLMEEDCAVMTIRGYFIDVQCQRYKAATACEEKLACPPTMVQTKATYSYAPIWGTDSALPSGVGTTLLFNVRACNDAHVMLTDQPLRSLGTNLYEIVIGGWSNGQSVIRTAQQQRPPKVAVKHAPLNCNEFRRFYVNFANGKVEVGDVLMATNEKNPPFMTYQDPTPFTVKYAYVSGWDVPAIWRFDTPCQLPGCAFGWVKHQGECYAFDTRLRLKSEAITFCRDQSLTGQGRLFDLNSQDEKDFIVQKISNDSTKVFWSDLTDSALEGDFHWQHWNSDEDDTKFVQQLVTWVSEPNDQYGNEDCVVVAPSGMLNDGTCDTKAGFICQRSLGAGASGLRLVRSVLLYLILPIVCRVL